MQNRTQEMQANEVARLVSELPKDAQQKLMYIIQGAALVSPPPQAAEEQKTAG